MTVKWCWKYHCVDGTCGLLGCLHYFSLETTSKHLVFSVCVLCAKWQLLFPWAGTPLWVVWKRTGTGDSSGSSEGHLPSESLISVDSSTSKSLCWAWTWPGGLCWLISTLGILLTHLHLLFVMKAKKTYEQKCRDKDEAEQAVQRSANVANPKQQEKVPEDSEMRSC